MYAPFSALILLLVCISSGIWQGCVSIYQPRELDSIPVDDYWTSINNEVQVGMEYNLLTDRGAKRYAEMGAMNGVSLLLITIQNSGQQEWNVVEDFVFKSMIGDSIVPLPYEEAMELMVDSVDEDIEPQESLLELNDDNVGINIKSLFMHDQRMIDSHILFRYDVWENYLQNQVLSPGQHIKGYLVLPVVSGTPLEISLKEKL